MNVHPALLHAIADVRALLEGDDDLRLLHDTLEGETGFREVCEAMHATLAETEAMADALSAQQAEMKARLSRLHRRAEALRDGLRTLMLASGLPKLELPRATLSIAKGQEAVRYAPDFDCPSQLLKRPPPPEPDGAEIKRQLKAGVAIDGAWLERSAPILKVGRT
jgi:hypothetical protein